MPFLQPGLQVQPGPGGQVGQGEQRRGQLGSALGFAQLGQGIGVVDAGSGVARGQQNGVFQALGRFGAAADGEQQGAPLGVPVGVLGAGCGVGFQLVKGCEAGVGACGKRGRNAWAAGLGLERQAAQPDQAESAE